MAKVSPAQDAFSEAAKNKLRRYPSTAIGKDRLIPFAMPKILTDRNIPEDATFFVAGDCFARSVEKSLICAGKTVLSSPTDLDLPGDSIEQFNRFTLYSNDVVYNQLRWALEPDEADMNGSLIEMGDELCDLQIQWTFSHAPETAKAYRKTFVDSFSAAADADVVMIVVGGREQWYDTQTGLYINGMVPNNVVAKYPGRFELHMLDQQDCVESIQRTYDLIQRTSKKKDPLVLVMNTPGAEPFTFSDQDSLVEHLFSRSMQRMALQSFVDGAENAEYVPAMEYVFLSDRGVTFLPNSYNHVTQDCVDRLMSEVLLKYQGVSAGQSLLELRGIADGLRSLEQWEEAVPLVDAYIENYWDDPSVEFVNLHRSVTYIYQSAGRDRDLADIHLKIYRKQHFPDEGTVASRYAFTLDHSFQLAASSALRAKDADMQKELRKLGKKHGAPDEWMERISPDALKVQKPKSPDAKDVPASKTYNSTDDLGKAMQEVAGLLRSDPEKCVQVSKAWIDKGVANDHIRWMRALALKSSGHEDALEAFEVIAKSKSEFATQAKTVGDALSKSLGL